MSKRASLSPAILDESSWAFVDETLQRFEQSWQAEAVPELARYVPVPGHALRKWVLIELIKVDQEYRWESGRPQKLEAYLDSWPELRSQPEVLAELLTSECLTRGVIDALPSAEELESRFPRIYRQIDLQQIAAQATCDRPRMLKSQASGAPSAGAASRGVVMQEPLEDRPRLVAGQMFGRYQIRDLLGQGAMATVYGAYDPKLDRDVALKIPQFTEPRVTDRFVREARSAAGVQHPNICPVYDVGQVEGTHYITMALLEGQTLAQRMKSQPFPPREAAGLIQKLAQALDRVHARGIIHRDIKPSNVMVDPSGEPRLMDFGLAHRMRRADLPVDASTSGLSRELSVDQSRSDSLRGTPAYMSPEQVQGETVDHRSDIYSLGVLFYQMLTGELPFSGPLVEYLAAIVHGKPPRPRDIRPTVPKPLEAICRKAMARAPGDRYQSAGKLASDLGQYLSRRPRSYRRRLLAAVAAPLLLLAGAVLYFRTGTGILELEVPQDATVTMDGNKVDIRSGHVLILARVGPHQLVARLDDSKTVRESFVIRWRGERITKRIALAGQRSGAVSPHGWWRTRYDLGRTSFYPFPSERRTSDRLERAEWKPERLLGRVRDVLAGDINGDGFIELVVRDARTVAAFDRWGSQLWRGAPVIDSNVAVPRGRIGRATHMELADFDQDGSLDIVVLAGSVLPEGWTNKAPQRAVVFHGDGNVITNMAVIEGANGRPENCFDYNRDGRVDIVCSSGVYRHPHAICIYDFATGNRLFRADFADAPTVAGVGDVNRDGANELLLLQSAASGVDPPVGDYDSDHCYVTLFDLQGNRLWKRTYSDAIDGCLADLDADGTPEILLIDDSGSRAILHVLAPESGRPLRSFTGMKGPSHRHWSVADVTGDGRKDIVVGDGQRLLVIDAKAKLVAAKPAPKTHVLATNDLNGDGHIEILARQGDDLVVFRGDLEELARYRAGGPILTVMITDIEGDGSNDVFLRVGTNDDIGVEVVHFAPLVADASRPDLIQPSHVARAFLTALRTNDVETAVKHVLSGTRPSVRRQLRESTPPAIPEKLDFQQTVHVDEAHIVALSGPRIRLTMRFEEHRWWVATVSWGHTGGGD